MKSKLLQIGQVFNRLTVINLDHIESVKQKNGTTLNTEYYLCKCECGNTLVTRKFSLKCNATKSCGCLQKEINRNNKITHNKSKTKLYSVWMAIKRRCYNKNCKEYKNYGDRGIIVCNEWKENFQPFYDWSFTNGYKKGLTIDRINNDGNYKSSNCRWTTQQQQMTNLRMLRTNKSGYKGVSWAKNIKEWICVISINNKSKRIGCYKTQKEAVQGRNDFINKNNLPHQKNVYIGELNNGY